MRSRKPSVVTNAVRAPRRSRRALVATVVPCEITSASPAAIDALASAAITPADWSAGVDGTLATRMPSSSTTTTSVKVPPTSTPTRAIPLPSGPGFMGAR